MPRRRREIIFASQTVYAKSKWAEPAISLAKLRGARSEQPTLLASTSILPQVPTFQYHVHDLSAQQKAPNADPMT